MSRISEPKVSATARRRKRRRSTNRIERSAPIADEDRFIHDKATLRAALERRARARRTITYDEAAALVGRPAAGLGGILRAIGAEEAACGRPDLSALVVTVSTGLPSSVGRSRAGRAQAIAVQEAVFAAWVEKG